MAFNTLFNLTSQAEQVRCFRNAARHLTPEGVFEVEAFVPDLAALDCIRTVHATVDSLYLGASVHDPVAHTVLYQYIEITTIGMRLYPVRMRYVWPSEVDRMAELAGLELR